MATTTTTGNLQAGWGKWRSEWSLPADVTYLNHGSFGPSPSVVQETRRTWSERLERQPMDFFVRKMEDALDTACRRLAEFVGADAEDMVFVDNATAGMNIVANSLTLSPGDEVLVTDQEYGAVLRIWQRACERAGAKLVVQELPQPVESRERLVEAFLKKATSQTRLIVVSHVTSPTAVILPIEQICQGASVMGIPVCIDGPHALAMRPLQLERMGCAFYTASCHKWLCAPFGSGFLYVRRDLQDSLQPPVMSWGTSISGRPTCWKDEFRWLGTRDPAAFLAIPAAIDFLESCGLEAFRERTHALAQYARQKVSDLTGQEALIPDSADWYGSMISLPLPPSEEPDPTRPGQQDWLQQKLWEEHKIEVPVFRWCGQRFLRVSCHLYSCPSDVDLLVDALRGHTRE